MKEIKMTKLNAQSKDTKESKTNEEKEASVDMQLTMPPPYSQIVPK